jgi:transposase
MKGFVRGTDRQQATLLPECLDDWVDESNPVRAVDVFVEALDLRDLGFDGVDPAATGRPAYHPSPMLKLYIYGHLNRVQRQHLLQRLYEEELRSPPPMSCTTGRATQGAGAGQELTG